MSTYLDIYTAQFEAAHQAYGDLPSGRPAMDEAFASLLVDGWAAMARQANDAGLSPTALMAWPGYISVSGWAGGKDLDAVTSTIRGWFGQTSLAANADDIWQAVATLAGYMAYWQLPSALDELVGGIRRAAELGGTYLKDQMLQVAKAAGAGALSVVAIVVALGLGYLLLMRRI